MAMLSGWFASDTADVFVGTIKGDSLLGRYRGLGGFVRFVRQR
jgi:hypothetical protein